MWIISKISCFDFNHAPKCIAAGTIPDPPKIICTASGNPVNIALLAPNPYPKPSATETIVILRADNGSRVINCIPLITIDENMITAAPPNTLWGMIEIKAANFGNNPHKIRAKSIEEAYELCQNRSSVVLGGMLWLKMQNRTVDYAIDLCDLGLNLIEDKGDEIPYILSVREPF